MVWRGGWYCTLARFVRMRNVEGCTFFEISTIDECRSEIFMVRIDDKNWTLVRNFNRTKQGYSSNSLCKVVTFPCKRNHAIFPPLFPTFLDSNPSNRSSLVSVILAHVSRVIIKIGLCGEWRVTKSRFNLDHFQLRNRIMNHPAK